MKISEVLMRINYYAKSKIEESAKEIKPFKRKAYNELYAKIRNAFLLSDDLDYSVIIDRIKITKNMAEHLYEIMSMKYNNTRNTKEQTIAELAEINGIGEVLAEKLYSKNIRSVQDLLNNKEIFDSLPLETTLFLKFKPLRIIPHALIQIIEDLFKKNNIIKTRWHIVGSYRRKKAFSRDIDIMIVISRERRKELFDQILQKINKIKDVKFHTYALGDDKISGILMLKNEYVVKLDLFACTREEYPFMLLYSTGSKEYNLKMRRMAKDKGYMLNQRGLFIRGTKTSVKKFVKTEKEIFELLDIDYVSPEQRT